MDCEFCKKEFDEKTAVICSCDMCERGNLVYCSEAHLATAHDEADAKADWYEEMRLEEEDRNYGKSKTG